MRRISADRDGMLGGAAVLADASNDKLDRLGAFGGARVEAHDATLVRV